MALCSCRASQFVLLHLQGSALLHTKPPGPCKQHHLATAAPPQAAHQPQEPPMSPLWRAGEMDSPGGEWCETHRCLSLVTRAAVSTQPLCSWMSNLVTRWLMDGSTGRRCWTAVLVLMSSGERSGRTVMPGKGWNGLLPAVGIPGEILPFTAILKGFVVSWNLPQVL